MIFPRSKDMERAKRELEVARLVGDGLGMVCDEWGIERPRDIAVAYRMEQFSYYVRLYFGEPRALVIDFMVDDAAETMSLDDMKYTYEVLGEHLALDARAPIAESL
jgi:hypothetical protein